jgi:hypothetical protein
LINGHLRLLRVTLERSAPCAWTVLQISKLHVMKARSSVTYIVNDLSCALIKFLNSSTSCLVKASRSPLSCSNVNTVGFVASHCNPSPPPALAAPQITSLSLLFFVILVGLMSTRSGFSGSNFGFHPTVTSKGFLFLMFAHSPSRHATRTFVPLGSSGSKMCASDCGCGLLVPSESTCNTFDLLIKSSFTVVGIPRPCTALQQETLEYKKVSIYNIV